MAYKNEAGLNVFNQYGARETGGAVGIEHGYTSEFRFRFDLTGEMLNSGFVPKVYIPKGARGLRAILRVDEAFAVSTSGTVSIGMQAAPATNGITLTEATLEAVGTKDVTSMFAGTWDEAHATGVAAADYVGIAISGTVTSTQGKGSLIVEFVNVTKV